MIKYSPLCSLLFNATDDYMKLAAVKCSYQKERKKERKRKKWEVGLIG